MLTTLLDAVVFLNQAYIEHATDPPNC